MNLHRGGSGEGQVVLAVFCEAKVHYQCSSTSVMMEKAQEKVLRSFQRKALKQVKNLAIRYRVPGKKRCFLQEGWLLPGFSRDSKLSSFQPFRLLGVALIIRGLP